MRALALVLALSGCALTHEIGHDAAIDVGPISPALLAPCSSGMAGPERDCGWMVSGGIACAPGARVSIGCSHDCGLGACTGDSMIRVCDAAPCTSAHALAFDDDGGCGGPGGVCSFIEGVTCPASGTLFVLTAPYASGTPYACTIASR